MSIAGLELANLKRETTSDTARLETFWYVRKHIDIECLSDGNYATWWNRFVLKEVNIFIWKLLLYCLPSMWNRSIKGLDIPLLFCHLCDIKVEKSDHVFVLFEEVYVFGKGCLEGWIWCFWVRILYMIYFLGWSRLSSRLIKRWHWSLSFRRFYGWFGDIEMTSFLESLIWLKIEFLKI